METQLETRAHSAGRRETSGAGSTDIHTLSCVKQIAGEKLPSHTGSLARCSVMIQGTGMEGEWVAQGRGDMCIIMADLHCRAAETITTL